MLGEAERKSNSVYIKELRNYRFTLLDAFFIAFSLFTFTADISTDIVVGVYYFHGGQLYEAATLFILLGFSTLIIHFFSMRWHVLDGETNSANWLWNVLQLGIIHRYILILKEGMTQRKKKPNSERLLCFLQHQSDVSMLRLFESFLESAPQLLLQLYIMFSTRHWNYFTEISAAISILSLAGGIASYNKTQRNANIHVMRLTWLGVFMQLFWRIGTLTSRILAMVLCASVLHFWFGLIIFVHWLAMTIWVILQKTDFCPTRWEELLYNCVIGVIYCFCFFNLKEGHSRLRVTVFYAIIFIEDIVFILVYYWLTNTQDYTFLIFLLIIILSFVFGILSMAIYYTSFHPKRREKKSLSILSFISDQISPTGFMIAHGILTLRSLKLTLPQWTQARSDTKSTNSSKSLPITPEKLNFDDTHESRFDDVVPVLCKFSRGHKHHSMSCVQLSNTQTLLKDLYTSAKANHHRLLNYNFRSQVASGELHPYKIHCSCLTLHIVNDNDDYNTDSDEECLVTRL